jgi:aspartate-semialdehyde dehydrogenase
MKGRIEVGVLGATGTVGQQFVAQLAGHPWFELVWVGASHRSEGQRYGSLPWRIPAPAPAEAGDLVVQALNPGQAPRLVFSALDAAVAGEAEEAFAAAGHFVVSNARNHRMDPVVPLLVPEINPDHLGLVPVQAREKGWKGAIVTNPNCSTVFFALALAPLRQFGLQSAILTTLQAASGAGYPGVPSLDLLGNVIPFIDGEEQKLETEAKKILGCPRGERVEPHPVIVSASTTRVPVVNGHTEMISVGFEQRPPIEEIHQAFARFSGRPQREKLPSAPSAPLVYLDQANRPQPRLDVERENGMTVWLGRLRPCAVLDYKFVALGHNTIRGAAGAAVLNAELMVADGLLE